MRMDARIKASSRTPSEFGNEIAALLRAIERHAREARDLVEDMIHRQTGRNCQARRKEKGAR